jgi:hypothetical protein
MEGIEQIHHFQLHWTNRFWTIELKTIGMNGAIVCHFF